MVFSAKVYKNMDVLQGTDFTQHLNEKRRLVEEQCFSLYFDIEMHNDPNAYGKETGWGMYSRSCDFTYDQLATDYLNDDFMQPNEQVQILFEFREFPNTGTSTNQFAKPTSTSDTSEKCVPTYAHSPRPIASTANSTYRGGQPLGFKQFSRDRKIRTTNHQKTGSQLLHSATPAEGGRQRLYPWLYNIVENNLCPGVQWIKKEENIFKVPWNHRGKRGQWTREHGLLFKLWAINTGRYKNGDTEDWSGWKVRVRCALTRAADIQELKTHSRTNDEQQPYRVYKFLPRKHKLPELPIDLVDITDLLPSDGGFPDDLDEF